MANALEFLLKLTDMLSPGMRQAANITNTASGQIQSQFAAINGSGKRMTASVNELRDRLEAVNKVRFGTTLESEFNVATKAAQRLQTQIMELEERGKRGGFMELAGTIGAGYLATEGIKSALELSAEKESQGVNLQVMTGSNSIGKNLLESIEKMSDVTPFEAKSLLDSGEMLLQFGMKAQDIMPTLQRLGDISGGNAEKLQQLTLAFGKVTAEGKLSGREMEEMIYAGFNPLQVISEQTGLSMAKLKVAMEKGAITTKMVSDAMRIATDEGGRFHNLMKRDAETLGGQYSTLMDAVHHKLRAFGDLLSPIAKWLMTFARALMDSTPALIAFGIAIVGVSIVLISAAASTSIFKNAIDILGAAVEANPVGIWLAVIGAAVAILLPLFQSFSKHEKDVTDEFIKLTYKGDIANEMYGKASEAIGANVAKARMLIGVISDENLQQGVRIEKLNELKKLDEEHFKSLTLVTSQTDKAKIALDEYTSSMWKHAYAMAAVNKYQELVGKELDKEMQIHDKVYSGFNGKMVTTSADGNLGVKRVWKEATDAEKKVQEQSQIAPIRNALNNTTSWLMGIITGDKGAVASLKGDSGTTDFSGLDGKAGKINEGGQKIITVNIAKQIEKLEIHVANAKETGEEIYNIVREEMRRVVYSLNGQTAN